MRFTIILLLSSLSFLAKAQMKNQKSTPTSSVSDGNIPILNRPTHRAQAVATTQQAPTEFFQAMPAMQKPALSRDINITRDADGQIIMVKGSRDLSYGQARSTAQKIEAYLTALQEELGFRQIMDNFEVASSQKDELGQEHVRMNQVYQGVPVYGAEIILHSSSEGEFELLNGRFFKAPALTSVTPKININQAERIVREALTQQGISFVETAFVKEKYKAALNIYHKNQPNALAQLAWHVTIRPNALARYEFFVDAIEGNIIHFFDHTCNFVGHRHGHNTCNEKAESLMDGSEDASARDLFGISRNVKAYLASGKYYLIDASRPMYKPAQSKIPDDPIGAIWTLDAFNTSPEKSNFNYDNVSSLDNKWTNSSTAISAHYNAGLAYNYFKNFHNRESINGKGGTIISLVNITEKNGGSMENAFWNGEAMFYGNGGTSFLPLARGLDVAGHEMSHGVIQNTAGLQYENESGAMNESFADIFGALIDRDDWKIGEDVVKTSAFPSGALRDLSNPNNGGTSLNDDGWQPKHINEKYNGTQDNGGVHINSGITNFAFYKYATALNKDKAEKVFYRALTTYLVKSSKFIDLRAAVQQSATDLYGANSNEVNQVAISFNAVGIGGGGSSTGTDYQKDVAVNPGTDLIAHTNNQYSKLSVYFPSTKQTSTLSNTPIGSRPSITDDGSEILFIAADKTIHLVTVDWAKGTLNEEVLSSEKIWRNAAISKDGLRIAVTKDVKENIIYVYDFSKSPTGVKTFPLTNPTYTNGIATGDVQYSDAMEFDVTGENIMYDAYNLIKGTKGDINYWDIGFLRVYNNKNKSFGDGKIEKLFSDLPEGTSIGNPSFSKNSPHIIAFDYQDEFDQFKTYIITANLQTSKTGEIYFNGKDVLGFPTFSRQDNKILFEAEDNLGNFAATIDLNTDKLSAKTTTPAEVVDAARWPIWFSNGKRVLVGNHELANDAFRVFPNPFDESITIQFQQPDGKKEYQITDITGRIIIQGKADNQQVTLDLSFLPKGAYVLSADGTVQKIIK